MLTKEQKELLIDLIEKDIDIPEDFKENLFPDSKLEYELAYAGKMKEEDVLANEDGVNPIPLQIDKEFNLCNETLLENWQNIIVFGDNLQFLKTINENKDIMIKDKVKGEIKLIYIDPPFATADEFQNKEGAKAYSDKKKGAEFIEFLRRRLILAREILAEDGTIIVHLDQKMSHYIKIIMDEIFGKEKFLNEIIWCYGEAINSKKYFNRKHDNLYVYTKKKDKYTFNYKEVLDDYAKGNIKKYKYEDEIGKYRIMGRGLKNSPYTSKRDLSPEIEKKYPELVYRHYLGEGKLPVDYWRIDIENQSSKSRMGYPTQKPEKLLEKIIRAFTNEGDLVLDFFGGSGTTIAVAEKLSRRWITCDLGKLSYFTMQKRILQIQNSNDLNEEKKSYSKKARNFITAQLGIYDLGKTCDLEWSKYKSFLAGLFEITMDEYDIAGMKFDGKKNGCPVKIFDYKEFKDSSVDEIYLENVHNTISRRISGRVYIVSPANYVDFISNYYEIEDIRYYFLKVPYQIIEELHKKPFQKLRQPQSKNNINLLDEVIGFHFIQAPEVKSKIIVKKESVDIIINEFLSKYKKDDEGRKVDNFQTLSAVFIDTNYDGTNFQMNEYFFADQLLPKKGKNEEVNIRKQLSSLSKKGITITLERKNVGEKIMIVYTDIFGNDFSEVVHVSYVEV